MEPVETVGAVGADHIVSQVCREQTMDGLVHTSGKLVVRTSTQPGPVTNLTCLDTHGPLLNFIKCVYMHSLFGECPIFRFLTYSEISPCPGLHAAE